MNITDITPEQTVILTIHGSDYPARLLKTEPATPGVINATFIYPNSFDVWDEITITGITPSGPWHTYFGQLPVTVRPMTYTPLRELAADVAGYDGNPDWASLFIVATLDLDPMAVSGDTLLDEDQAEHVLNAALDLQATPA